MYTESGQKYYKKVHPFWMIPNVFYRGRLINQTEKLHWCVKKHPEIPDTCDQQLWFIKCSENL